MYFKIHVSLQHKQNIREDPNMDNHYKGTEKLISNVAGSLFTVTG